MSSQPGETYHAIDIYLEKDRSFVSKELTKKRYQAHTRPSNLTQFPVTSKQVNGNIPVSEVATRIADAIASLKALGSGKMKIIINAHCDIGKTAISPETDGDDEPGDDVRYDMLGSWLIALGVKHKADDGWKLVFTLNACHSYTAFATPFCEYLRDRELRCFSVTASPHSLSQNAVTGKYLPFLFGKNYFQEKRPQSWQDEPGAKRTLFCDEKGVITETSS